MSKEQLVLRLLGSESRVDAHKLRTGHLSERDWTPLSNAAGRLAEAPIYIDDTAAISVLEMQAKARRLKAEHGLDLIIVDYLQLMRGRGDEGSREQEISNISRSLKTLAKELQIPVIALSQLNRAVETRPGKEKRPMLADLRESGAIEQDADVILFIYRDEVYNKCECPPTANVSAAGGASPRSSSGSRGTVRSAKWILRTSTGLRGSRTRKRDLITSNRSLRQDHSRSRTELSKFGSEFRSGFSFGICDLEFDSIRRTPLASEKATISENVQKYLEKSDWKSAIAEMEKLFAIDQDPIVRVRIGDARQKLNQKAEAVKEYIRAADLYAEKGFVVKALAQYKLALRLDPSSKDAQKKMEGLHSNKTVSEFKLEPSGRRDAADQQRDPALFRPYPGRVQRIHQAHDHPYHAGGQDHRPGGRGGQLGLCI